jgi:hypothetical protein
VPPAPLGFLYSQIGYDAAAPKRALVRGPRDTLADATFTLRAADGTPLAARPLTPWGELWGSHWWIADFSAVTATGKFRLEVAENTAPRFTADLEIAPDLLHARTWNHVSIEQAERRQRLSEKHEGKPLGWYDAGAHWQEANAHTAYLLGLADLLAFRGPALAPADRDRLVAQLLNGADYLALLQDIAARDGHGDGPLVHQSFKLTHLVLPQDAPKAAAAWTRVAAVLPPAHADLAAAYRARARRALDWFLEKPRHLGQPFCGVPHGVPDDFPRPDEFTTPDLAQCVQAALDLDDPRVFALAARWLDRQVTASAAPAHDGLHGHFTLFATGPLTEKTWTHGFDPAGYGFNCGRTDGHNLIPLVALLARHPGHPDAPRWRSALHAYAYGYFLPACRANPFLLAPLGHYPGQGLIWFGGLWHGGTALYGQAAALALEFARLFPDDTDAFHAIATGNLQWIAGLNAGLTRESLTPASHMWSAEIPPGVALPASLINGIGQRTAGTWLNLRGCICNGFATGDQFVWDVPATRAADGPHAFTDEDWITHAGAWLSATARLAPGQ